MSHCNADNFQRYLNAFSKHKPRELKVMVLDNGAFHKAKRLVIADNIILIFLPPYSPELNPAEKIWWSFKRQFTNNLFYNLNDLENYVCSLCIQLNKTIVKNTCAYKYIILSKFWYNL